MSKKITLIIAVAMMLAGATTAQAYSEHWGSYFFDSGTITCNDTTYTFFGSACAVGSYIYAWTYDANIDSMTGTDLSDYVATFIHVDTIADTSYLYLELVNYGSYKKMLGKKDTDTLGENEGDGTWTGYNSARNFYVTGTWSTGTNIDSYYFDYGEDPPVGSGPWAISSTVPVNKATGSGIWEAIRGSYTP